MENEAELSGSEASDDEDEHGQNQYEAELGDMDRFDNNKIRSELERMALYVMNDSNANFYTHTIISLTLMQNNTDLGAIVSNS